MVVVAATVVAVGALAPAQPAAAAAVIHVDQSATGSEDGSSWGDAYTDLQAALGTAVVGDEIRVAEGTYTPGPVGDRTVTFELVDGVTMTGGYPAGGAGFPDPDDHETVLSGDLAGDDLFGRGREVENSYSVVSATGVGSTAVIDGFTITAGNADDPARNEGGGIRNDAASPTIVDTTISDNGATFGGGIFNTDGSSPTIIHSTISGNTAAGSGGGIYNTFGSSPTITETTITANTASSPGGGGGGIYNVSSSSPKIVDSIITDNTTSGSGGGIHNVSSSSPTIISAIIGDNSAGSSGGGMANLTSSSPTIISTTITDNTAAGSGGGISNSSSSSPTIINATIAANTAGTGGGIRSISSSSPTVVNTIVWANAPDGIVDADSSSMSDVRFSDVQGWAGAGTDGNIDADPMFVGGGDWRLREGSPARDAGDDAAVPADSFDVDGDGDVSEPTPDGSLGQRIRGPAVDLGAHESPGVPDAPTAVTGVAGDGSVSVSWVAPVDDGGFAISSYVVTAAPGGAMCTATAAVTGCAVAGLSNGTGYTFTVTATNQIGTGPESAPSSTVTPLGVPGPPRAVTGVAGDGSVSVSWVAPVDDGGAAISSYLAMASPGGAMCTTTAPVTGCVVAGLSNGTGYTFTVTATNRAGTGPASVPSTLVTPLSPVAVPGAPTAVAGVAGDRSVSVSWVAPMDDGGAAILSYVAMASPGGATCTAIAPVTGCAVGGLVNGTGYTFTVTATNGVGTGPASAPSAPVTPIAVLPPPPVAVLPQPPVVNCSVPLPHPFTDVSPSSFAANDVGCIHTLEVTTGTSATTFSPAADVTREQMASFLARLYRAVTGNDCVGTHPFTDVSATSFAKDDVGCLHALGVTTGTSATTYSPGDHVTREQMASLLARLHRVITAKACAADPAPFTDVSATSFARTDIGCIRALGVTTGTSATTYSPADGVTREQMASFLARLYRAVTT